MQHTGGRYRRKRVRSRKGRSYSGAAAHGDLAMGGAVCPRWRGSPVAQAAPGTRGKHAHSLMEMVPSAPWRGMLARYSLVAAAQAGLVTCRGGRVASTVVRAGIPWDAVRAGRACRENRGAP